MQFTRHQIQMPKEDYLLKYLEKLSRVIAAMLGFMTKDSPEDALKLADETYKELLSIHLKISKKRLRMSLSE